MSEGNFLHKPNGVSSISSKLNSNINDYKNKVSELIRLIEKINNSSSWKDEQVKTAFINTCNSYITEYKTISSSMEEFVKYLNGESNKFSSFESAYTNTRRG